MKIYQCIAAMVWVNLGGGKHPGEIVTLLSIFTMFAIFYFRIVGPCP
jgi:hypothetical protein